MLNFYHEGQILSKPDEEIFSSCYDYFKINQDTLSDVYHLLVRFHYFLHLFEKVCLPSDDGVYLVKDQENHQDKVFYRNGKPLLNLYFFVLI